MLLGVLLNLLCPVHTYRLTILKVSFFCSDIDHNDNYYYHDPYSDMPRLSLVDKARVIGRVYEKVDGRVRVWSRPGERFACPACSPGLNPIGQLWDQLGRAVRTRVTIATMQDLRQIVEDEWNGIPQQFSGSYSVWGGGTRLLLRHLVVPPTTNVVNVSNEV